MMDPGRNILEARGAPPPLAPARRRRFATLHSVAAQGPQALRLALRTLAARRGLAAIRIVTLALVVGAGSAVFLVADAMLLRPLPFKHAERLVRVFTQPPGRPDFAHANPLHPLEFIRFRERPGLLERLEGISAAERAIGGDGEPESVPAASVWPACSICLEPRPSSAGRLLKRKLGRVRTWSSSATGSGCAEAAAIRESSAGP